MAKAKKPEDPFSVGHHMGKWCGYDVLDSGDIRIAQSLSATMEEAIERETGLRAMQECVASFVARELAACAKVRKEWWRRVYDELSLPNDPAAEWSFNLHNRTLRKNVRDEQVSA